MKLSSVIIKCNYYCDCYDRLSMRVSELQSALFSWYDFNETQKELAYLLKQERHQLECLCIATDLVTFSEKDLHDTIADLKVSFLKQ